jgi:hypothetical protein
VETVDFTATFLGLDEGDPVRIRLRSTDERGGVVMRSLECSIPVFDAEVLAAIRAATPGAVVRVIEATDWDHRDLPNSVTAFSVLQSR